MRAIKRQSKHVDSDEWTMEDHAEFWWAEQGKKLPKRGTAEWEKMYEAWIDYAFSDL